MENLNNKKVSVIIPCYNNEAYVEEAINSVIYQTYKLTRQQDNFHIKKEESNRIPLFILK